MNTPGEYGLKEGGRSLLCLCTDCTDKTEREKYDTCRHSRSALQTLRLNNVSGKNANVKTSGRAYGSCALSSFYQIDQNGHDGNNQEDVNESPHGMG